MSEQPDKAPEAQAPAEAAVKPPRKQRPKMSLDEQIMFLRDLIDRCKMHTGDMKGYFAGEAMLCLKQEDMLKLETVEQTLAIFELHKADEYVRRETFRRRSK